MEQLADYILQLAALLLLSGFAVAIAALALSWLADVTWHDARVQMFWHGPGVAVAVTAAIALALGVFVAVNWADDLGLTPV